jgi:hypothetical protein
LAAFAREYLTGSDAVFDCVIDTPEKIHISEGSCDSRELKRRADRDPEAYARGAQPGKADIIRDPGKVRGLAEIKLSSTEAFELAANVLDNPALYTDDTVKLMEKISNKMKPSPAPAAAL